VGAGGSLEASFALRGEVPAGAWRLVGDGIIVEAVDVTFDILWRRSERADLTVVSWQHHIDPLPGGEYLAQAFEDTATGAALDWRDGDLLVPRFTAASASSPQAYIPNGDGATAGGRIPFIELPR
jgi:hypothetical protein